MPSLLAFSSRLTVLPVVHGSGDFAIAVRKHLLSRPVDCLAVPLPGSFADAVCDAVDQLPAISAVVQMEKEEETASYVPIDPCQPVIAAIRWARSERVPIEWIDLERWHYESITATLPDPYALKTLSIEQFATAVLPFIPRPVAESQQDERVRRLAFELHRLEIEHENVVAIVNFMDWPWVREAYLERFAYPDQETYFEPIRTFGVKAETLLFFLGELPYITALYERARATLDSDENLSIDGVKDLLLKARDRWLSNRKGEVNWITPKLLQLYLQYVRNLTLLERRLSPDLYTLVTAAKQVGGDRFAISVLETARDFPLEHEPLSHDEMKMGIGQADMKGVGVCKMKSRLPGMAMMWRRCDLIPESPKEEKKRWSMQWDPYRQCSWPPEDERIESFHTHVRQQAKALIGADLAKTEKFTTTVKDGIDIRETLRNWHKGDIYVREVPPARGGIEVVVFLFDVPADPDVYRWRTTWHAEHDEESTIGLFATDFRDDLVGPGIGRARYGGVFFIFPPRPIHDIWHDPRVLAEGPLEDRLLSAAILHSHAPHIAVVSPVPLKAHWRRMARARRKKLIHLPLSRFSGRTIDRVRTVHVLNGQEIRSYASRFIRGE